MNTDHKQLTMASTRRLLANGVDWSLIVGLRNRFSLRYFVETGTAGGNNIVNASELFDKVWSIETDEELHKTAKERTKHLTNTNLLLGSSLSQLPVIMERLDQPTLFYLDAHWCGGEPTEKPQCPLIDELQTLWRRFSDFSDVVVIDDANMFLKPPLPPYHLEQWPSFQEIQACVSGISPKPAIQLVVNQIILSPEPLFSTLN